MEQLLAISPIDGRYYKYTKSLSKYFSEYSLFRYRLLIEIKYLVQLLDVLKIETKPEEIELIKQIFDDYTPEKCLEIKKIEKQINHDVKAVEYYIKMELSKKKLHKFIRFVHFGLTSQDINNTATPLSIKQCIENDYTLLFKKITKELDIKSQAWKKIVMITRTHGQPAVPSTFGKEIKVFLYRLEKQYNILKNTKYWGKFGGASGNLNAHKLTYPNINWIDFSNKFLFTIDLNRNKYTTQIDNYENLATVFDCLKRINSVLIDMCRDIWTYISMNYLKLKINKDEVGSSAMPHKVNPINFENAEGNLMIANSLLEFLSRKLPISRLQRDLTDSTVLRNLGTVFGHIVIAFHNIIAGLSKIDINKKKIDIDISQNIVVIAEGIQVVLKKYGFSDSYEILKKLTRINKHISQNDLNNFIETLDCSDTVKEELRNISINDYIGYAGDIND